MYTDELELYLRPVPRSVSECFSRDTSRMSSWRWRAEAGLLAVWCDFLGISDLISLKVEHYVGTARLADECRVRYPIAEEMVKGKQVLIVDDIADTEIGRAVQQECGERYRMRASG